MIENENTFSFFQDESVQEIAENHIQAVQSLESDEAERIMKLYQKVRHDLRDRLDHVGSGTFTAQHLRGVLLQVELGMQAMNERLLKGMTDGAEAASTKGVENLIKEIEKWNKRFTGAVIPINLDAVKVASDTSNFLINRYEVSLNSYSQAVRGRITQSITEAALQEMNYSEMVGKLGSVFQGEEWKLHQIVRTELHNVYNVAKINGMQDLWDDGKGDIPDLKKTLFHPMDKRTGKDSVYLAQHNPIVPIDEPFVEDSTGRTLTYMAPPNRPNDRAILIPYREAWSK